MEKTPKTIPLPYPAEKLLIHRPPMLLIDALVGRQGDRAEATARLEAAAICRSDARGLLQEYFLEIVAQTMAAANGYDGLCENSPPKDGFIVGIDSFVLEKLPGEEQEFTVAVCKKMEFGPMKVMEGEVRAGETVIARAELKVWEQGDDES